MFETLARENIKYNFKNIGYRGKNIYPPGMRRCSDVSFRSHIGRYVADHAKASSRRRNWYVNETS